jgi:predicted Fe-Mo cluster-binding NifX family protein
MTKTIAVPINENGILDAHFGHCKFFAMFEIEDNKIIAQDNMAPPPHEPGVIPKWVAQMGATDIIAGGMGQKAIQIFNNNNVNVFVGAEQLPAEEIVKGFLNKSLEFNANYCDH